MPTDWSQHSENKIPNDYDSDSDDNLMMASLQFYTHTHTHTRALTRLSKVWMKFFTLSDSDFVVFLSNRDFNVKCQMDSNWT